MENSKHKKLILLVVLLLPAILWLAGCGANFIDNSGTFKVADGLQILYQNQYSVKLSNSEINHYELREIYQNPTEISYTQIEKDIFLETVQLVNKDFTQQLLKTIVESEIQIYSKDNTQDELFLILATFDYTRLPENRFSAPQIRNPVLPLFFILNLYYIAENGGYAGFWIAKDFNSPLEMADSFFNQPDDWSIEVQNLPPELFQFEFENIVILLLGFIFWIIYIWKTITGKTSVGKKLYKGQNLSRKILINAIMIIIAVGFWAGIYVSGSFYDGYNERQSIQNHCINVKLYSVSNLSIKKLYSVYNLSIKSITYELGIPCFDLAPISRKNQP